MFNEIKQQIEWGGKVLELTTGKIARQADGCVIATYGGTVVMCTVVSDKKPKEGVDFLPLTVIYREMAFAAGKIPGGFHKREGRPSEKEVLVSRLIDRPIRPLFPENYYHETQVVCTVLCHDLENDPDVVAMVATSAALAISGVEFHGPIAGCRVGYINGEYVLNPTINEMQASQLDLVIAGTEDSVLMVEAGASELSEEVMLKALDYGHDAYKKVVHFVADFAKAAAKPRREVAPVGNEELGQKIKEMSREDFIEAYKEQNKQERSEKLGFVRTAVKEKLVEQGYNELVISFYLKKAEQDIVRGDIINHGTRIDNRKTDQIRKIESEVGVLGKAHGSALFTRGETQALVVSTLGTTQDEQIMDLLQGEMRENFMLHYNFPPYSVGEATQMKPPGRREIGHGKLAWRAVQAVLPSKEAFPYTIRIVAEITESNGSSSMATVCGSSLSLMDAGVPITRPVAGIAMGLIKEGEKFVVLSDISGDEDYLGDMDFKVAGTDQGITALQMDIKIKGITLEIMNVALRQAKEGRMHILHRMASCMTESRKDLNENAPTITSIVIPKDKIREVIGSGGTMIRKICELSGAKIDIEDTGTVKIASNNAKASAKALEMINEIVLEPEKGRVYQGVVVKIMEFGAFVKFMGAREGLVHVSEISHNRIAKVTDVLSEGDEVKVVVLGMDNRGKVKLSMKYVDQATGELSDEYADAAESEDSRPPKRRPRPDGDSRDSRDGRDNRDGRDARPERRKKFFA